MDIPHGCTVPLRWIIEESSAARALSTRDSQCFFELRVLALQRETEASYTPSPKQCQLTDLPEMCARRAASATDMGTLWCGAACDAIFLSVLHASAGASRHRTGLTRRAQQAANMVI